MVPAKVRVPAAEALPRERLEAQLASAVERHRLTLVIAPAGAGKTTLLARFASSTRMPVAWYRAETWDDDPARMLRHLEASLGAALPGLPGGWTDVEVAARALEQWAGGPAALVIDDLHALEGTAAEAALSRLVDYAPPWLRILAASRVRPDFNLPRLRVSGDLLQIEGDDLRFRSWEVERLFRDFYRDPVPPGELAVLAAPDRGLGGRPPAVPPGDPRQVRGRAAPDPRERRVEHAAPARVPHPERPRGAARRAAAVPGRHVRPRRG